MNNNYYFTLSLCVYSFIGYHWFLSKWKQDYMTVDVRLYLSPLQKLFNKVEICWLPFAFTIEQEDPGKINSSILCYFFVHISCRSACLSSLYAFLSIFILFFFYFFIYNHIIHILVHDKYATYSINVLPRVYSLFFRILKHPIAF